MNEGEFFKLTVESFPTSTTRMEIFKGFQNYSKILSNAKLAGEIWANGSFLTEKEDPTDIDVVFRTSGEYYDSVSQVERDKIDQVLRNYSTDLKCDSYHFYQYSQFHPLFSVGQQMRSYWLGQWGFSRGFIPKGIALIKINGGNII
nr:hypothetical protein [Leptospira levettii]